MNYWNNQQRQYVDFRLRQAARGGVPNTTPTNFGTISLFNNSNQFILVVRSWQFGAAAASSFWGFGHTESRLTGTPGTVNPVFPQTQTPPGLVDYSDQAVKLAVDLTSGDSGLWNFAASVEIPYAAIPPGWSFYMTQIVTAKVTVGGFLWDWCTPDEL